MPTRPPELGELQALVLAADEGSLGRASRVLGISRPAAAKRVRNLEALAGRPLLTRSPRGVRLTIEGGALYAAARRILAESELLMASLRELREGPQSSPISGIRELLGRPAGGQATAAAETVLAETEALFAHIFHASTDGIIITRVSDGLIYEANEAYCDMLQWPRESVVGHTSAELSVWADQSQRTQVIETLHDRRSVGGIEVELLTRAREVRYAQAAIQRIEIAGEQRFLTTFRDVTAQKSAERRLVQQAEQNTALAEIAIRALAGESFKALSELGLRQIIAQPAFATGALYQTVNGDEQISLVAYAGQRRLPQTTSIRALLDTDLRTLHGLPAGSVIEGVSTPDGDHSGTSRCWYGPIGVGPGRDHMLLAFADDRAGRPSAQEHAYLAQICSTLGLAGRPG